MNAFSGLWEFLTRDVTFFGGPHSPMLSWLGSGGIVLFFLWKMYRYKREIGTLLRAYARLRPRLIRLAEERGDVEHHRFQFSPRQSSSTRPHGNGHSSMRIDCDDIQVLDSVMQQEPLFRDVWNRYRKTLILEQVPWFMEPRIFSTARAEEVFTEDALITRTINMPGYRQIPSVVTGLGLLLTFLALFIGLGKLHADGSEIVGIQGLINGLAGKFLTSIIGLMAANLFSFIEQPMVARLMKVHHEFLEVIDRLFPKKTMEQMLEQLTALQAAPAQARADSGVGVSPYAGEWGIRSLKGPMADLTSAIQTLTTLQREEQDQLRKTVMDLPYIMKKEFPGMLRELTDAIQDLSHRLKETSAPSPFPEPPANDRPLLWRPAGRHVHKPSLKLVDKLSGWSRPAWMSRQRRTG